MSVDELNSTKSRAPFVCQSVLALKGAGRACVVVPHLLPACGGGAFAGGARAPRARGGDRCLGGGDRACGMRAGCGKRHGHVAGFPGRVARGRRRVRGGGRGLFAGGHRVRGAPPPPARVRARCRAAGRVARVRADSCTRRARKRRVLPRSAHAAHGGRHRRHRVGHLRVRTRLHGGLPGARACRRQGPPPRVLRAHVPVPLRHVPHRVLQQHGVDVLRLGSHHHLFVSAHRLHAHRRGPEQRVSADRHEHARRAGVLGGALGVCHHLRHA